MFYPQIYEKITIVPRVNSAKALRGGTNRAGKSPAGFIRPPNARSPAAMPSESARGCPFPDQSVTIPLAISLVIQYCSSFTRRSSVAGPLRLFRIKKHMLQRPMLPGSVQGNINFPGCQNLLHADGNAQFRHTHQVPPLIAEFFLRCPGMNRCCRASADNSRTWARIRRIVVNNLRKYFLFHEEIWRQSFIQSSNNRN